MYIIIDLFMLIMKVIAYNIKIYQGKDTNKTIKYRGMTKYKIAKKQGKVREAMPACMKLSD
jgi:hypothetical protein